MVCNMTAQHLCSSFQMGIETSRLCHGLHPSSNWNRDVHGAFYWHWDQAWWQQVTCFKVTRESLWPKTSLSHLQWIFNKQIFCSWFWAIKSEWVWILLRVSNFHCVCWWWDHLRKSEHQLSNIVKELKVVGLDIEDQGHLAGYAGVNIGKHDDGSYEFTQCALIDSIKEDVCLSHAKATTKPIPAAVKKPLNVFKDSFSSTMTSITAQLYANSTTLCRQCSQT